MSSSNVKLPPLIKWAGGKENELPYIVSNLPREFENYYEPFVGGGSVYCAIEAKRYFINDISEELIGLYRCVKNADEEFYSSLGKITDSWKKMLEFARDHQTELYEKYVSFRESKISDSQLKEDLLRFLHDNEKALSGVWLSFSLHHDVYEKELKRTLIDKFFRMRTVERRRHVMPVPDVFDNVETAFVGALYMYLRFLYNDKGLVQGGFETALFVFIRSYSYSGMFRYNSKGDFNVPYGGIAYNHNLLDKKLEYYKSAGLVEHLNTTDISSLDFEEFFRKNPPGPNDFVFLDPPYDSIFSTYAKNEFTQDDHKRLARYLIEECKGKWMMIIKNTPLIQSLYDSEKLTIKSFEKKYQVSFMNRNDKNAEHLIIMNYNEG